MAVRAGKADPPVRGDRAPVVAILLAMAVPAFAFGLYAFFGEPRAIEGNLDQHLADKPTDGRGWVLLARLEFERGRYPQSAAAFERAVAVSRKVADDAAVWCEFADAVGMAQGRRLEGKPAELIERARSIDPGHPCALEMAGSVAYERADFASAARHWRQLLGQWRGDEAARRELAAAVERAERLAQATARIPPGLR